MVRGMVTLAMLVMKDTILIAVVVFTVSVVKPLLVVVVVMVVMITVFDAALLTVLVKLGVCRGAVVVVLLLLLLLLLLRGTPAHRFCVYAAINKAIAVGVAEADVALCCWWARRRGTVPVALVHRGTQIPAGRQSVRVCNLCKV